MLAPMTVLVVDDEYAGRKALINVIVQFPQLTLIAEASDGKNAINLIRKHQPDIIFLDIEMPEVNGFAVAEIIHKQTSYLIFVTAFQQYALDAFATKAIDYILKPARPERIKQSLEKIISLQTQKAHKLDKTLVVNDGIKKHILTSNDISYIESIGRYQRVHLTPHGIKHHELSTIITDMTMDYFENELIDSFYRLHRQFLVNLSQVKNLILEDKKWWVNLIEQDATLPVARGKNTELKQKLSI